MGKALLLKVSTCFTGIAWEIAFDNSQIRKHLEISRCLHSWKVHQRGLWSIFNFSFAFTPNSDQVEGLRPKGVHGKGFTLHMSTRSVLMVKRWII